MGLSSPISKVRMRPPVDAQATCVAGVVSGPGVAQIPLGACVEIELIAQVA